MLNSLATTVSIGRTNFPLALANSSFANSILSSSTNEVPVFFPKALRNVNIIAPPTRTLSAFTKRFSITPILSDTLAPPKIATKGLSGLSTAPPMNLISFSIKNPAAVFPSPMLAAIPTFEAWALWAVPNASFTNRSPKDAQYFPNSGSFLDSFLPSRSSNLVFSNIMISPSFNSATAASNSTPLVAGTNLTGCPNNSANLSATGLKDFLAKSSSVLTFPKWEKAITLPPFSSTYFIVGKAATILFSSVIFPSFIGTLKSTLINTFCPLTFKSVTIFLAI